MLRSFHFETNPFNIRQVSIRQFLNCVAETKNERKSTTPSNGLQGFSFGNLTFLQVGLLWVEMSPRVKEDSLAESI